jgi:hypothetical protein
MNTPGGPAGPLDAGRADRDLAGSVPETELSDLLAVISSS